MPSYVAWTAAILYQLYRHALPSALAALFHPVTTSSSSSPLISQVLAVLRVPFYRAASTVLVVGIAIQTAVLLEQETADRVGTWLNSRIASSPSSAARAATPGLLDLLYIAESPASITGGGGASYASTLSALLTVPLTLPVVLPPPRGGEDDDTAPVASSFSEREIREWDAANAVLRAKLERGMVESAEQWLDVLEHVPLLLPDSAPESESDTLLKRRIDYLAAVRTELDLVAARNPTRQVYALAADHDDDDKAQDAYWRALELREREREERHRLWMEDKFERWLDEIFSAAAAEAAKAPDADSDPAENSGGGISNDDAAMQLKRRRRETLDVPLAGKGRPGPTWRDQLRVQWKSMFDPAAADGVLGHVDREMDNLAARFRFDDDNDDDEEEAESRPSYDNGAEDGWTPDPLPLMAAHHLRAQLASTIADLRAGASSGGDGLFAAPAHGEWERATLPPSLDAWPDEFLSLEQLAIRIDRRARQWALRILRAVSTRRASSFPGEDRTTGPLSIRKRVNLLRPASTAPFPAFMRTVDATFKVPRDPAHFRIGISQHDLANAIFALPADPTRPAMALRGVMAREQGEGGCSALQRTKWRREAGAEGREEVERRLLLRDQQLRRAEGRDSQSAGTRNEL